MTNMLHISFKKKQYKIESINEAIYYENFVWGFNLAKTLQRTLTKNYISNVPQRFSKN